MDLLADGLSNKDIGHHLGLTEGTVKQHLATIFRKLGVTNRTWAASLWRPENQRGAARQADIVSGTEDEGISVAPPRLFAVVVLKLRIEHLRQASAHTGSVYAGFWEVASHWGAVFDGQVKQHAGGHLVATFGYPTAHIDDVERSLAFSKAVCADMSRRFSISPLCAHAASIDSLVIRGGTVVDTSALRRALRDAYGPPAVNLDDEHSPPVIQDIDGRIISLTGAADYARVMDRAVRTAPFAVAAQNALACGRACWLSIEAWPPIHGKHFLDAFADTPLPLVRHVIKLRPPAAYSSSAQYLAEQIESQFVGSLPNDARKKPLGWWLEYLGEQGPTLVMLYGAQDLESFRALIADDLLARLAELPLLFLVGALPLRGAPRLAVRLLGERGERPMVGRLHEIALPDDGFAETSGYPDLCALVDQASVQERHILVCLSRHALATRQFLAKNLGFSLLEINRGIERLERLGLVLAERDGPVQIRDSATQKAIATVCGLTASGMAKI